MNNFIHDVRHGWRSLLKSPGFTLVAVLTLALGGPNAAIFTSGRGGARDLPTRPDQLAVLGQELRKPARRGVLFELREEGQSKTFETWPPLSRSSACTLSAARIGTRLSRAVHEFSRSWHPAAIGRGFESTAFARPSVVGSATAFWQRRYGRRSVGASRPHVSLTSGVEIVGVMRPIPMPNPRPRCGSP